MLQLMSGICERASKCVCVSFVIFQIWALNLVKIQLKHAITVGDCEFSMLNPKKNTDAEKHAEEKWDRKGWRKGEQQRERGTINSNEWRKIQVLTSLKSNAELWHAHKISLIHGTSGIYSHTLFKTKRRKCIIICITVRIDGDEERFGVLVLLCQYAKSELAWYQLNASECMHIYVYERLWLKNQKPMKEKICKTSRCKYICKIVL